MVCNSPCFKSLQNYDYVMHVHCIFLWLSLMSQIWLHSKIFRAQQGYFYFDSVFLKWQKRRVIFFYGQSISQNIPWYEKMTLSITQMKQIIISHLIRGILKGHLINSLLNLQRTNASELRILQYMLQAYDMIRYVEGILYQIKQSIFMFDRACFGHICNRIVPICIDSSLIYDQIISSFEYRGVSQRS